MGLVIAVCRLQQYLRPFSMVSMVQSMPPHDYMSYVMFSFGNAAQSIWFFMGVLFFWCWMLLTYFFTMHTLRTRN